MPPNHGQITELARISREILGAEPSANPGQHVKTSGPALRQAIEAAYYAGRRQPAAGNAAADPELFFWQLMDSLPDNVYFKDTRSRFICVNRAQARFLGVEDPNDAIGKSDFDYFPEDQAKERFDDEQEIMSAGVGYSLHEEKDLKTSNEKVCIISSKLPLRDAEGNIYGTFGISRDVTDRYLAEREVERQRSLLEAIIQILPCRVFVRDRENRFILVNEAYREALGVKDRKSILGRRLSEFCPEERIRKIREEDEKVREQGKSILNEVEFDKSVFKKESWVVTSKVPLRGPDMKIEGIVGMTYDISEQKLAEEEARRLSVELREKNAQYEAELQVARQLQETLMSIGFDAERHFCKRGPQWSVEASYLYKPSHHLAGDFFELIPISENKLGILVCDVMGHGVKAALVTMLLRGLITEMPTLLDQPGKVLAQINNRLCSLAEDQDFPRFTTAVYLTLNLETGSARVANAGHPGPLWKRRGPDGQSYLEPCPSRDIGPALGLIPNQEYLRCEFDCQGSTDIFLYTDGIIEQTDARDNEFGKPRLEELLLKHHSDGLAAHLKSLRAALRLTAGTDDFDDDLCVVAIRMRPNS